MFHYNCFFCFHSGTNWRESAVLGTMFVLEKFDLSINFGKFVMCIFYFFGYIPVGQLAELRIASL